MQITEDIIQSKPEITAAVEVLKGMGITVPNFEHHFTQHVDRFYDDTVPLNPGGSNRYVFSMIYDSNKIGEIEIYRNSRYIS